MQKIKNMLLLTEIIEEIWCTRSDSNARPTEPESDGKYIYVTEITNETNSPKIVCEICAIWEVVYSASNLSISSF